MMTQRTKITGFAAIMFALMTLVGVAVFLFMLSRMNAAFEERQNEVAARQAREQALAALERRVLETEDERAALTNFILPHEGVVDLLSLIELLGVEQHVLLQTQSVDVVPLGGSNEFETLKVTVLATGSYEGVLHILELLEQLPYQSELTSVTMTKSVRGTVPGAWDGTFTIAITKYTAS